MAGKRILIVEDEGITALDIRQTVRQLGYKPVGLVGYGKDAIKHALTLHPDLIIMDIVLKGPIDGIQAAAAIRSQYPCPVIYLTARADQSTIDRAKATEPAGYVLKPINDRELRAAIELALCRDTNEGTAEEHRTWLESPASPPGIDNTYNCFKPDERKELNITD